MGYYERKVKRLFNACRNNDLSALKEVFSTSSSLMYVNNIKAADIESRDAEGNTPLLVAAQAGSRDVLRALIEKNANIQARNKKGETALMLAAGGGNREIMADLLEKGLKIVDVSNDGQDCMMHAAMNGHGHIVKFLLEQKASVNSTCHFGKTPLMYAAEKGSEIVVNILLAAGADIDARANDGRSATMLAAYKEHKTALQALLSGNPDLTFKSENGYTARELTSYHKKMIDEHMKKLAEKEEPAEGNDPYVKEFTVIETKPKTDVAQRIATAMETEGLDPAKSEHWLPVGSTAIEYIAAGTDSPKMLCTSFNFASRQYMTSGKNLLTGESYAVQTGALEVFPNQDMVVEAHGRLIKLGKEPPPWPLKKTKLPSL